VILSKFVPLHAKRDGSARAIWTIHGRDLQGKRHSRAFPRRKSDQGRPVTSSHGIASNKWNRIFDQRFWRVCTKRICIFACRLLVDHRLSQNSSVSSDVGQGASVLFGRTSFLQIRRTTRRDFDPFPATTSGGCIGRGCLQALGLGT
jgi:hypothetical protein